MKTNIPLGLSKNEYMKRYRKIINPDSEKIKKLKLKCFTCRKRATSFLNKKPCCNDCYKKIKQEAKNKRIYGAEDCEKTLTKFTGGKK